MNKNKAYWSAMGIEAGPRTDQKELKAKVEQLINRYGFDNVATQLRLCYKAHDNDVGMKDD